MRLAILALLTGFACLLTAPQIAGADTDFTAFAGYYAYRSESVKVKADWTANFINTDRDGHMTDSRTVAFTSIEVRDSLTISHGTITDELCIAGCGAGHIGQEISIAIGYKPGVLLWTEPGLAGTWIGNCTDAAYQTCAAGRPNLQPPDAPTVFDEMVHQTGTP